MQNLKETNIDKLIILIVEIALFKEEEMNRIKAILTNSIYNIIKFLTKHMLARGNVKGSDYWAGIVTAFIRAFVCSVNINMGTHVSIIFIYPVLHPSKDVQAFLFGG